MSLHIEVIFLNLAIRKINHQGIVMTNSVITNYLLPVTKLTEYFEVL